MYGTFQFYMVSRSFHGFRHALQYHPGFGSEISSEALPHALPKGQVSE